MYKPTGILEGSSVPPENDVDDEIQRSQKDEGAASHDQYEGERPEVLVQRNHPFVLLSFT